MLFARVSVPSSSGNFLIVDKDIHMDHLHHSFSPLLIGEFSDRVTIPQ
jgi:hypothetical protein